MPPRWSLKLDSRKRRASVVGGIRDVLRRQSVASLGLFWFGESHSLVVVT